MAKRADRVGSIGLRVKTGHGSKRVIFKRVNRVTGQTGLTRFAMSKLPYLFVGVGLPNRFEDFDFTGSVGGFTFTQ